MCVMDERENWFDRELTAILIKRNNRLDRKDLVSFIM